MQNTNGLDSSYDITLSGESNAYFDTVNTSTLVINRPSTTAVNSLLGSTINVGSVLQNSNFDTTNRLYQIWNDTASSTVLQIDTSNSNTVISADGLNLNGQIISIGATDSIYLSSVYTIDLSGNTINLSNATVSFPSSTVSFDSNLPTTTITTGFASNNFITKAYSDAIYGRLAIGNTWDENNIFTRGILPRTALTNTNIQISANAMANRQSSSLNNIGIGLNSLVGDSDPTGYVYSTGSQNIGIGNSALQQQGSGNSCIAIGHQAMQLTGLERIYGAGVSPSRCIAIGEGSQKVNLVGVDNITIGYNTMPSNVSGQGNILIGSNVGGGLSDYNGCLVIGSGALPSAGSNAVIVMGYQAMGASTGGGILACVAIGERALYNCSTSGCLGIGYQALYDLTTGYDNQGIGYQAGSGCITGVFNQFIGRATNTTKNDVVNSVCLGYNSQTIEDYEFVIGGNAGGYPRLTIPEKTRLACNQTKTGVTINLTFRTNENILLTDATTTTINLPTPNTNGVNEGCKFYINRKVAGVNITINSPSGQFIALNQINGSYTATGTYLFLAGMNCITVLCIGSTVGGTNWQVLPTSYSQGTDNLYTSAVNPIPTTAISIPFAGTTVSGYQPYFMDNANLNYRQSTTTLTATNLTVPSTLTATNATVSGTLSSVVADKTAISTTYNMVFSGTVGASTTLNGSTNLTYNPVTELLSLGPAGSGQGTVKSYISKSTTYQYLAQNDLITSATTLVNYYSYIPFTMPTAAAYSITLPQIIASTQGMQMTFKRIGGSLQILSITAVANQPTFLSGGAIGTTTATNAIISATQSCCKITSILSQKAGSGTFTNLAGSATITIVTVTGTTVLSIGGIINCNGNVRYITAYGTGLGIGGTYTVNAVIAGANTGQSFTTSDTYGWSVDSVS